MDGGNFFASVCNDVPRASGDVDSGRDPRSSAGDNAGRGQVFRQVLLCNAACRHESDAGVFVRTVKGFKHFDAAHRSGGEEFEDFAVHRQRAFYTAGRADAGNERESVCLSEVDNVRIAARGNAEFRAGFNGVFNVLRSQKRSRADNQFRPLLR